MSDVYTIDDEIIRKLIADAGNARNMAYARYSQFKVGAALLAGRGNPVDASEKCTCGVPAIADRTEEEYRVFTGCNIENASYGAAICAERAAVCNAISSGYREFKAIAIVGGLNSTGVNGITYPCGICRQVLSEFAMDMYVIAARSEDDYDMRKLSEFLPASFGAGQIK